MANQHSKPKKRPSRKSFSEPSPDKAGPDNTIRNDEAGRAFFKETLGAAISDAIGANVAAQRAVNPCTRKAIDQNLPHFTLLPGDNFTTILIEHWIKLAVAHGTSPEKTLDARAQLKRIEQWRTDHPTACKIPS